MSIGKLQNREPFLNKIAEKLGRKRRIEGVVTPTWSYQPQWGVFKDYSQDSLLEVLKKQCSIINTDFIETSTIELIEVLKATVDKYGGGPVVTWKDPRFSEYGLKNLLTKEWPEENIDVFEWNTTLGVKNIEIAEKANVGITFSDETLAESGTVVLFSNSDKGRSVSLLPTTYIAIIPKSTIVPRMTQTAHSIHNKVKNGEVIPACINFITGPSNSADIEMNLVVGVHGPIKATYIVVNDK